MLFSCTLKGSSNTWTHESQGNKTRDIWAVLYLLWTVILAVDCIRGADIAVTTPLHVNPRLFMDPSIFTTELLGRHSFIIIRPSVQLARLSWWKMFKQSSKATMTSHSLEIKGRRIFALCHHSFYYNIEHWISTGLSSGPIMTVGWQAVTQQEIEFLTFTLKDCIFNK